VLTGDLISPAVVSSGNTGVRNRVRTGRGMQHFDQRSRLNPPRLGRDRGENCESALRKGDDGSDEEREPQRCKRDIVDG
jgi:hypothetical protein